MVVFLYALSLTLMLASIVVNICSAFNKEKGMTIALVGILLFGISLFIHERAVELREMQAVEICNIHHGRVTLDFRCIVGGEVVEFSPGVWEK